MSVEESANNEKQMYSAAVNYFFKKLKLYFVFSVVFPSLLTIDTSAAFFCVQLSYPTGPQHNLGCSHPDSKSHHLSKRGGDGLN